jgi:hypothetical protein
MTTITLTNIDSLDAKTFELLSNYLAKKGVEFEINQTEPISAPKQKKSAPKSKAKSDFDRDKYLSVAKTLGCYGKKGVWKSCRQFVYAVMDGEITEAQGQDLVRQLKESKGWA